LVAAQVELLAERVAESMYPDVVASLEAHSVEAVGANRVVAVDQFRVFIRPVLDVALAETPHKSRECGGFGFLFGAREVRYVPDEDAVGVTVGRIVGV
jgi:hypothetical protein